MLAAQGAAVAHQPRGKPGVCRGEEAEGTYPTRPGDGDVLVQVRLLTVSRAIRPCSVRRAQSMCRSMGRSSSAKTSGVSRYGAW